MMQIIRSALAVLLTLTVATETAMGESSFADIQRVLDQGKLLVAVLAKDAPPVIMTDDQGAATGSEIDLARDLGRKMGVDIEFVRTAVTYDDVVELVARKEADVAVSFLSSNVRRAEKVLFSRPYVTQHQKVFFNRASFAKLKRDYGIETIQEVATIPAAETIEIGVLEGTVYETTLKEDLPQLRPRLYQGLPEMMSAVRAGKIFAGLHGQVQIEFFMSEHPDTAIYVAVESTRRSPSDISIAVRPDSPNLLRLVNIYLANHVGLLSTAEVIERYQEARKVSESPQ